MRRLRRRRLGLAIVVVLVGLLVPSGSGVVRPVSAACLDDPFEDNDTWESAALLGGLPSIGSSCDDDYFRFDAYAGQDLVVDLSFGHTSGDLDLAVREPNGTVHTSAGTADLETVIIPVATSGTHHIRVYPHDGVADGNPYSLHARRDGALFVPIVPIRILDTRSGVGWGAGAAKSGEIAEVGIQGHNGIPPDAVAVTGNLTVVGQTSAGFVTIAPGLVGTPATSTINVPLGDTRANGVTVGVGSGGSVNVQWMGASGATAHLVLDVTGYFRSRGPGAVFQPLTPTRLVDTRSRNGLTGPFDTSVVRTFAVTGRAGVPPGAVAVTGNLTAVGASSNGYVSLGPTMTTSPTTSTLNVPKGDTRANGVTVALSGSGTLSAVWKGAAGSRTHLLFDVTGYFITGATGASFFPLTPGRDLDTRSGVGLSGAFPTAVVRTIDIVDDGVQTPRTVPPGAVAVTGNLTAVGASSNGYVSLGPTMTTSPTTSTLNVPKGDTRANGVTVALSGSGTLSAVWKGAAGSRTHLLFDVTGYFR